MRHNHTTKHCTRCRKAYRIGYNGVVRLCDECAGVERDGNGYAWFPWEREQEQAVAGKLVTVTRAQAFGGKS